VLALLMASPPTAPGVTVVGALTSTCDPLRDNATDPVPNSAYGYGLVNAKAALDAIHPPVGDFPTPTGDTQVADASGSQGTADTTASTTGDTSTGDTSTQTSDSVSTG
jgi:hypothetical protein